MRARDVRRRTGRAECDQLVDRLVGREQRLSTVAVEYRDRLIPRAFAFLHERLDSGVAVDERGEPGFETAVLVAFLFRSDQALVAAKAGRQFRSRGPELRARVVALRFALRQQQPALRVA